MNFNLSHFLITVLFLASCAAITTQTLEQKFGKSEPRERVVQQLPANAVDYWHDVQPLTEKRCIVCHGCYDAPCQLKMTSIEGMVRGASKENVYHTTRLTPAQPTRLFEDAQTVAQWRDKGFTPVFSEFPNSPQANREASVMYQLLQLKKTNPLPEVKQLPKAFDLSLDRKQFCSTPDRLPEYSEKHPLWGMPYALPGLPEKEQAVLLSWIEQGATYTPRPALAKVFTDQVQDWEVFFNGDSLKQQLMSRYIFEHLFHANLYFSELGQPQFFRMVRSSTPPGESIKIIATRLPIDNPGVERVYYRLQAVPGSIVEKAHLPYALNAARMLRWRQLFVDPDYALKALPGYAAAEASNPFVTFGSMPIQSRYAFMLDEAQFTIMGFTKGPVCRGQVAVDVIQDHFWVFFLDPAAPKALKYQEFLASDAASIELPAANGNNDRPLHFWLKYKKQQEAFLARQNKYLESHAATSSNPLDAIWYGDGSNSNAALTIFRHVDSASVSRGLLGQPPKTAWIIDYSLLERIHYLLVAGYDVFGNVSEQLNTRLYMDFLRMEGESNFLLMLPESARKKALDIWYQGASKETLRYLAGPVFPKNWEPRIAYKTDDPKLELFSMLEGRLKPVLPIQQTLAGISNPQLLVQLERLQKLVGKPVTFLPPVAFLQIQGDSESHWLSLVHNDDYSNLTSALKQQKNRLPEGDTLTPVPGFIGAYPNAFYTVKESGMEAFVDAVSALATESDYSAFLDSYGIRRTDSRFWSHSDDLHKAFWEIDKISYGSFDFNRLENR
jgi:hypothetical protein